ncbi:MAG: putative hemolysin activation/secretion protein [Alphaproteobacteria bacterium]|nr:putative hemolysin activation/secretion protein [Alphaproteobacteria bacterium]
MNSATFRRKLGSFRIFLGLTMPLASLLSAPAGAQTVPPAVPPAAAAPTREQIEQRPPTAQQAPAARLTVEGGIERAPCALDRPDYQNIRFTPTEVIFDDLKGIAPEALRPAYAQFLGREQPVSIVCEIRDRAATILREAGYIASVEVPVQRIADGRLRFEVLMARMVRVSVRGDAGRSERHIASYLERLTRDEVFNRYTAERALLLAGDLPGYTVRLALRSAGQARGEVVGEVTVLRTPFMADANIQNYGSHALGRWGAMYRTQFFGLTGLGDRTTVAVFSTLETDEQQTLQIGHEFGLGSDGLTLAGNFIYARSRPDLEDDTLDLLATTYFGTVEANYPFIRRLAQTVRGAVGLDIVNQNVEFNGLDLTRDRLRVAYLRFTADTLDTNFRNRLYNAIEPRWRLGGSVEVRRGLDIFGASNDCRPNIFACIFGGAVPPSRIEGDPTATVLRTSVEGEYRPMPRVTFAASARGQYSKSPVLSFEEFSAGNYTVGRGYDPGALVGDRGVGLQAEVRAGSVLPRSRKAVAVEPYLFVDQAVVWNEDRLGRLSRNGLTSAGGGVRASLGGQFRLDVTLAKPLDRIAGEAKRRDPRLLVSLSSRLWPWSFR